MADISSLIDQIDKINVESLSPSDRFKLQTASNRWLNKSARPWDTYFRMGYTQVIVLVAIRVCIDLKIFHAWTESGGEDKSATELAKLANAHIDPALLQRLLRILAANGIVNSVPGDKFGLAAFSRDFRGEAADATTRFDFDFALRGFRNLPAFLKATNYNNPADVVKSNFTTAMDFDGTLFDYCELHPEFAHDFNLTVTWMHSMEPVWTEIFPSEKLLQTSSTENQAPILVDIGGGLGDAVKSFTDLHSVPRDAVVLQDVQSVLDKVPDGTHMTKMEVDFFKPQPVKGARAYLMSHVLHDWPDHKARAILANVKTAMTPGHSQVLLYEIVLRSDSADTVGPTMDMLMMTAVSAAERTLDMWKGVVEGVGLAIKDVHYHPRSSHAVIEIDFP